MPKKLALEEFIAIYSKVPRLSIELIIRSENGVLLTLRDIDPFKGYWHLPGGTILYSETIAKAANRIAKEELGVKIKLIKLVGAREWMPSKNYHTHDIALHYEAEIEGVIILNEQASKFSYFKSLPENTIPVYRDWLKDYFNNS